MNKKRVTESISQISLLTIILLGYYFLNDKTNFAIPCLFYEITNLYCPGCGITRCLFALLEGKVFLAFHYNALVCVLLSLFLLFKFYKIYLYINSSPKKALISPIFSYILLIATILFGILRNFEIFKFLAPIE